MTIKIIAALLFALSAAGVAFADEASSPVCGGIAGLQCGDGQFCDFQPGTCGAADQTGMCMPKPDACTREFRPVCGCDDKTYPNDCERRSAGVALLKKGACEG